jgi:hypothetical protein
VEGQKRQILLGGRLDQLKQFGRVHRAELNFKVIGGQNGLFRVVKLTFSLKRTFPKKMIKYRGTLNVTTP